MKTAYQNHKASAKQRGIEFLLTYEQWIGIWTDSGRLLERGRAANEFCMARIGDSGPYAVGNVHICTNAENAKTSGSKRLLCGGAQARRFT